MARENSYDAHPSNRRRVGAADFDVALACAALEPGLSSILVFDCSNETLHAAAATLSVAIQAACGQSVDVATLNGAETDEHLWGRLTIGLDAQDVRPIWSSGQLVQHEAAPLPRIVVIPDLARLGLPLARACISLIGADVAGLQRQGQNFVWRPRLWWLAGCARSQIGEVAPHLLDRLAVRLSAPAAPQVDRLAEILDWVNNAARAPVLARPPTEFQQRVRAAARRTAEFPAHIASYIVGEVARGGEGARRDLTLARLSRAVARWEDSPIVRRQDVDAAAGLLDLDAPRARQPVAEATAPTSAESTAGRAEVGPRNRLENEATPQMAQPAPAAVESIVQESVIESDTELRAASSPLPANPYPEDAAPNRREVEPLKPPPRQSRVSAAADGAVVGTRPATEVRDLAIVSTLLEAAKFRKFRPVHPERPHQLRILRSDLRSYRRAPAPEQLLVVVLDYTCLAECDWQAALLPHLSWAYVERAAACLVQVGSAGARNPFRADSLAVRNLLSPSLGAALEEAHGAASPLAHGLELAGLAIRAGLEHGRGRAQRARLVILTDGRGNVPLDASHAGAPPRGPVSRQGVDDALKVASDLRALRNTDTFLLDPQPSPHAELPLALAEALGCVREPIATLDLARTGT